MAENIEIVPVRGNSPSIEQPRRIDVIYGEEAQKWCDCAVVCHLCDKERVKEFVEVAEKSFPSDVVRQCLAGTLKRIYPEFSQWMQERRKRSFKAVVAGGKDDVRPEKSSVKTIVVQTEKPSVSTIAIQTDAIPTDECDEKAMVEIDIQTDEDHETQKSDEKMTVEKDAILTPATTPTSSDIFSSSLASLFHVLSFVRGNK